MSDAAPVSPPQQVDQQALLKQMHEKVGVLLGDLGHCLTVLERVDNRCLALLERVDGQASRDAYRKLAKPVGVFLIQLGALVDSAERVWDAAHDLWGEPDEG